MKEPRNPKTPKRVSRLDNLKAALKNPSPKLKMMMQAAGDLPKPKE